MESIFKELQITSNDLEVKGKDSFEIFTRKSNLDLEIFDRSEASIFEDSKNFFEDLFIGKEIILNENWNVNESIQGKILSIDENLVYVDCLMDLENKIFQSRSFPKELFTHLTNLKIQKPVLIKTKLKPGSIRIDIFPGDGIVDLKVFETEEKWKSLRGKNLGSKLNQW